MSQLIRCTVRTPYRLHCNCPVKWERGGWRHAPELETGVGEGLADKYDSERRWKGTDPSKLPKVIEFHKIHVGHIARTSEEAGWTAPGKVGDVYSCFHSPHVDPAVEAFMERATTDRPSDLKLAEAGQWIKRRTPPPPEGQKRAVYVLWECSERDHRGWREEDDPRGTCDVCLARTAFERVCRATGEEHRP